MKRNLKRTIAFIIALMTLLLAIPSISVFAEGEILTSDKTEYIVGEAIMVTAVGSGKDWVGIYYPDGSNSLYWAYIDASASGGVGSGVAFDITAAKKNSSAPSTLPAGDYIIRLMPNDTSDISKALAEINVKIKPDASAGDFDVSGGDLTKLNVPKTVYKYDEPINISAIGSGKDWVGIYYPDGSNSLYWAYVDAGASNGIGSGVVFDIENAPNANKGTPSELPAGNYIIRLMPNDTSDISKAIAYIGITILPKEEETTVEETTTEATHETAETAPETTVGDELTDPGQAPAGGDSAYIFMAIALISVIGVAAVAKKRENR